MIIGPLLFVQCFHRGAVMVLLWLLVVLSGCATTHYQPQPEFDDGVDILTLWQARQATLSQFQHWQLQGRLSIYVDGKSWQATFHWDQRNPQDSEIEFFGLFGQRLAKISETESLVRLWRRDESVKTAANASILMESLGWRLPIDGLHSWVLGLPQPDDAAVIELDQGGRLYSLKQSGWHIQYTDYKEAMGLAMPHKMVLETPEVRLKMVLDRWTLPGQEGVI